MSYQKSKCYKTVVCHKTPLIKDSKLYLAVNCIVNIHGFLASPLLACSPQTCPNLHQMAERNMVTILVLHLCFYINQSCVKCCYATAKNRKIFFTSRNMQFSIHNSNFLTSYYLNSQIFT